METDNDKKPIVSEDFVCKKHVQFFKRCLDVLPSAYCSLDTSRFVYLLIDEWQIEGISVPFVRLIMHCFRYIYTPLMHFILVTLAAVSSSFLIR